MLEHLNDRPTPPRRCVVIGAAGFVGSTIVAHLKAAGIPTLGLSSSEIDLLADDAATRLAGRLEADDAVVLVSALAPCKDVPTLVRNLRMVEAVSAALREVPPSHLVYISSDAVYADSSSPLTEESAASAPSLHGAMHRAREVALGTAVDAPVAILRPSLLYGAADPHNGYGPNRFRRIARDGGKISLFGGGEELRDHVCVDDLGEIVLQVLTHRSRGVLNVATGRSVSFRQAAETAASHFGSAVEIADTPRQNPITHRHFDVTALLKAFPSLRMTDFEGGLEKAHRDMLESDG